MSKNNSQTIRWYVPFLYMLFIIYGSLIPFHVRTISLADALEIFSRIDFLDLGIVSRADWVANILLYLPLGFLLTGWLSKNTTAFFKKFLIFVVVVVFCFFTAVSIEFFQIFFSPRTVSLNDLVAETMGTLSGIYLWFVCGPQLLRVWRSARTDIRVESASNAFFFLYIIFLLGIALFPFDFLISVEEITWKYNIWKSQPLLMNGNTAVFLLKTMAEAALFAPVGAIVAVKYRHDRFAKRFVLTVCVSFFSAFFLEFFQFFTASGVSQFFSVLVRVLGAVSGLLTVKCIFSNYLAPLKPFLKYLIVLAFPVYFFVVLKMSGWFKGGWLGIQEGLSKFDYHMMLPFYYHYFSTETRAVLSTLFVFFMYSPIGFSGWLLFFLKKYNKNKYLYYAAFFSTGLSLLVETGKLFKPGLHPDYTNTLVACFSAVVVFESSDRLFSVFHKVFNE